MVDTQRLTIHPLNAAQLELYLQANGRLEKLFNLSYNGRTVSPDIREMVMNFTLPKLRRMEGDDYQFLTFWILIERVSKTIVGELGFKGIPNSRGEIEIGYGTMPSQRGKGFMTEAVGGMLEWARKRENVHFVIAETDKVNIASIRIMEKNQFVQTQQKDKMIWWQKEVRSFPIS